MAAARVGDLHRLVRRALQCQSRNASCWWWCWSRLLLKWTVWLRGSRSTSQRGWGGLLDIPSQKCNLKMNIANNVLLLSTVSSVVRRWIDKTNILGFY